MEGVAPLGGTENTLEADAVSSADISENRARGPSMEGLVVSRRAVSAPLSCEGELKDAGVDVDTLLQPVMSMPVNLEVAALPSTCQYITRLAPKRQDHCME